MENGTKTPVVLEKIPNDVVKGTEKVPVKKEKQVLGSLIECGTPECKNTFVKKGCRHEFCEECQEKKHGKGYKTRVRVRNQNRKRKKYTMKNQRPQICAKPNCTNTFIPTSQSHKYCSDHSSSKAQTSLKLKKCKARGCNNRFIPSNIHHKFCDECRLKRYGPAYLKKVSKSETEDESVIPKRDYNKRKSLIYTTVYERELNGSLNEEAKELLLDFLETLSNSKVANFELIEIAYPETKIEIRETK